MGKKIENYTLLESIGKGNYGDVYKAINQYTDTTYAIKMIPKESLIQNPKLEECMMNEVKVLTKIGPSKHIVHFFELIKTKNNHYFVYQFCNGGTLQEKMKKQGTLKQEQALKYAEDLLIGFKVLNKHKVLHRDLKPQNILFHDGVIKLADFGLCKGLQPHESMAKTMVGSPIYMAPEILKCQSYTSKADIWSFGVILYQMLYGECPFYSNSIAGLTSKIEQTQTICFPAIPQVSENTKKLIKKMLIKDHFRRIGWIELFRQFSVGRNIGDKLRPQKLRFCKDKSLREEDYDENIFCKFKKNNTTIEKRVNMDDDMQSYMSNPTLNQIQNNFLQLESVHSLIDQTHHKNLSHLQPKQGKTILQSCKNEWELKSNHPATTQKRRSSCFQGLSAFRIADDQEENQVSKKHNFVSAKFMKYLNISEQECKRPGPIRSRFSMNSGLKISPSSSRPCTDFSTKMETLHKVFLNISGQFEYAIRKKDFIQIKFFLQYLENLKNKLKEAEAYLSTNFSPQQREGNKVGYTEMIGSEVIGIEEVIKMGNIVEFQWRKNKQNQQKRLQRNSFQKQMKIVDQICFQQAYNHKYK